MTKAIAATDITPAAKYAKLFLTPANWESSFSGCTTNLFWDCECDENYIHDKNLKECPICKAQEQDMPDAHYEEVLKAGFVELVEPYEPEEAFRIGSQYGAMEMLYAFERAGIIHDASLSGTRRMVNIVSKATTISDLRAVCDRLAIAIKKGKFK